MYSFLTDDGYPLGRNVRLPGEEDHESTQVSGYLHRVLLFVA